jgi:hypothetical protein
LTVDSGFGEFSLCVLGVLCGLHLRDVGLTLHDVIGIPPDVLDFRFLSRGSRDDLDNYKRVALGREGLEKILITSNMWWHVEEGFEKILITSNMWWHVGGEGLVKILITADMVVKLMKLYTTSI